MDMETIYSLITSMADRRHVDQHHSCTYCVAQGLPALHSTTCITWKRNAQDLALWGCSICAIPGVHDGVI